MYARAGFDFLGFHVRWVPSDRTGRMFPLWRPRRAALQRVKERLKARAKSVSLDEDASVMIADVNRSLRGWAGYYWVSNASADFKKVDRFARDQVRIWLCRKYRERSRGRARWPSLWLYHRLGLHCLVSDVRSGARSPPHATGEARRRAVCGKTARTVR